MKSDRLFILLTCFVSLLLPLACACAGYQAVLDEDIYARWVKYADGDWDDPLDDIQDLKGVNPTPDSFSPLLESRFAGPRCGFALLTPLIIPSASPLRC